MGMYGGMWHIQFRGLCYTEVSTPVVALARYANVCGLDYEDYGEPPVGDVEECEHGVLLTESCDACANFQLAGYMGRQMLDMGGSPSVMRDALMKTLGPDEGLMLATSLLSTPTEFCID